jgi:hypothetical protein
MFRRILYLISSHKHRQAQNSLLRASQACRCPAVRRNLDVMLDALDVETGDSARPECHATTSSIFAVCWLTLRHRSMLVAGSARRP